MARADCPHCGGTGWRTMRIVGHRNPNVREAVLCDCTEENRSERLMDAARIPKRYQQCEFESFDVDHYDEGSAPAWNQSLKQARMIAQAFAREYPTTGDCGLLFMGPCGVGKTHLAVAVLRAVIERGHTGLFYDYRELLKQIQSSYSPSSLVPEGEVLEPVLRCEVLLLDDLGAGKPSDWVLETVGHILNTRYNEKRVTLITTNYLDTPSAPAGQETPQGSGSSSDGGPQRRPLRMPSGQAVAPARLEDTLTDRIGQRIRSRLYEMCRTVEITAPDYRKEIRQAGRL